MKSKQIIAALKKPRDEKSVTAAKAWLRKNPENEDVVAVCSALLEYQRTAKHLTWLAKWLYQHAEQLERFVEQTKLPEYDLLRLLVQCETLESGLSVTSVSALYSLIGTMTNERTVKLARRFIEQFPDAAGMSSVIHGLLSARPVRTNFDLARQWLFADRKRMDRDSLIAELITLDFSEDLVPEALWILEAGIISDSRYRLHGLCNVGLNCSDTRIRQAVLERFRRIRPEPRADVDMRRILDLAYCTEDEVIAQCVADWCDAHHSASSTVWEYALEASAKMQDKCFRWLKKHENSPAFERVLLHYIRARAQSGTPVDQTLLDKAWRLTETGVDDANILLWLDPSTENQRRMWKWVRQCKDNWAEATALSSLLALNPRKSDVAYAVKWARSNPQRIRVADALFSVLPRKEWVQLMNQILEANRSNGYFEQSLAIMLRGSKSAKLLQQCKERVQAHVELGRTAQIGSALVMLLERVPKDEELKKAARRWLSWNWQGRSGGKLSRKVRELIDT